MKRSIARFIIIMSVTAAASASAQETTPGPGTLEITAVPAGAVYFNQKGSLPSFGNYGLGGTATYNFTRFVGVEGEGGFSIATHDLQFGDLSSSTKAPDMLSYNANLVVAAAGHSVVPYATGGVGGLTMFKREEIGLNANETLFTSNIGGGVKWYASGGRWGLRGDYRFFAVPGKDTAPAFFGTETRYGSRVYGAVIINAVK